MELEKEPASSEAPPPLPTIKFEIFEPRPVTGEPAFLLNNDHCTRATE